jgi:hypothetical protein
MAGYNRGIVATRKLNKKNKARLGRGGDTKIREVSGRDSHVNALEAYLIDVDRKAGEDYAKRVGAGTTNPLTGMPEYQDEFDPQQVNYETFRSMDANERAEMMADWGIDESDLKYIDTGLHETHLQLAEARKERGLAEDIAGAGREFTERGLGLQRTQAQEAATREAGFATAGITAGMAGTRESLGRELSAGSRGIGQSMIQARTGAESAAAKSGFARSGTVTGAMGQQMKALTQGYGQMQADYAGGIAAAGRQADIASARVGAGEQAAYKTAQESYGLGMEQAASTAALGAKGRRLDWMKTSRGIEEAGMDKFYADMAEFGGEAGVVDYGENKEGKPIRYYQGKMQTYDGNNWIDDPNQQV